MKACIIEEKEKMEAKRKVLCEDIREGGGRK